MSKDDVLAHGARVADEWIVLGQRVEEEARLRVQRTWLVGRASGASALIVQFAAGNATFEEALVPGTEFRGELAFFPGPVPERALIAARSTAPIALTSAGIPGHAGFDAMLDVAATALASAPFTERFGFHVHAVVPVLRGSELLLVDREGAALPADASAMLPLLALSGGHAIDLAGEWDGARIRPLAIVAEGTYHPLGGAP